MVKHKEKYDDDIDLWKLFLTFWKYKNTFTLFMVIGLILGLAYSHQQIPRYMTNFNVVIGHPAYNSSMLMSSGDLQYMISLGHLNPSEMPRLTYRTNEKTKKITFQLESFNPDVQEETKMRFNEIITNELKQIKHLAEIELTLKAASKSNNNYYYPSMNELNEIESRNLAVTQIPVDEILTNLRIIFSPTIKIQPTPIYYGILGMSVGLLLVGFWVVLSLFFRAIQKRIP